MNKKTSEQTNITSCEIAMQSPWGIVNVLGSGFERRRDRLWVFFADLQDPLFLAVFVSQSQVTREKQIIAIWPLQEGNVDSCLFTKHPQTCIEQPLHMEGWNYIQASTSYCCVISAKKGKTKNLALNSSWYAFGELRNSLQENRKHSTRTHRSWVVVLDTPNHLASKGLYPNTPFSYVFVVFGYTRMGFCSGLHVTAKEST